MESSGKKSGHHSIPPYVDLADLACSRLGGRAVAANDEFFAPRTNLVKPEPAVFIAGRYTARGKWMDGWETRRRRTPGHDWCVVQLGVRGRIVGLDVDTSFFTGNYPSHCSVDVLDSTRALTKARAATEGPPWITIVPKVALRGDAHNYLPVQSMQACTHLRLNIYPDGGVARFRAYGEVEIDWPRAGAPGRSIDLAAIRHGGLVLAASDMHFGAKDNIIMPGRAKNMGDGWETRRRRGPGHDWLIVKLGTPGVVRQVEIDTNHFKGNYPERASIEACLEPGATLESLRTATWKELLPQTKLEPHHRHVFDQQLQPVGPASHVRLNIFPDGGISRLRIHGTVGATR